jgi:hypothetical protein
MPRIATRFGICFLLAAGIPVSAAESPISLTYRPAAGVGSQYRLELSGAVDYPLGTGVPIEGSTEFGMLPQAGTSDDSHEVIVCLQSGQIRISGQQWTFSEHALAWRWALDGRRRVSRVGDPLIGVPAIIELIFRFVFTLELPDRPVSVGETWRTEYTGESVDGRSIVFHGTHTLTTLSDVPEVGRVAVIESKTDIPVDSMFVGQRFVGGYRADATVQVRVSDGEIVGLESTGSAELRAANAGLSLVFRELKFHLTRIGPATETETQVWREAAEVHRGLSSSSLSDAVLSANVARYLKDNWAVPYPSYTNTSINGPSIGGGVVARYHGDYLGGLDVSYGTASGRALCSIDAIHGYPIQPKWQEFAHVSTTGGGLLVNAGVFRYAGRPIGAMGVGRMRFGLDGTSERLVRRGTALLSSGTANFVTLSASRSRGGLDNVGYHHPDWDFLGTLTLGGGPLGGDFRFAAATASTDWFYHYHHGHTLAARLRLTWKDGNVPDQYRAPLTNGIALRGFGVGDAPLVDKAASESLEYRFKLKTPGFLDRIGFRDLWGAAFVDAGVGGDTLRDVVRSPLYADAGVLVRGCITYMDVPVYMWGGVTWPVAGLRGPAPRLTAGFDWPF